MGHRSREERTEWRVFRYQLKRRTHTLARGQSIFENRLAYLTENLPFWSVVYVMETSLLIVQLFSKN